MKQSVTTTLLAVLMSIVGIKAAHAIKIKNADGVPINYDWINNNTELAVSCYYEWDYPSNGYTGNVVIPESVVYNGKTYKVTSIHQMAFWGCRGLTSVTIPNSVTTIDGDEVFALCYNLTSITIPNSVTSIDCNCFEDTPWYKNQPDGLIYAGKVAYRYKGKMPANTHIDLKEGTLGISPRAFMGCFGLTSVTIPNSVTNIGYDAFANTSITSVIIPKSVTAIKGTAFSGCSGLTSIQVESGNLIYDSRNNSNAIIDSNNQLIVGCKNTIIPNSVTSIGDGAFSGCNGLTSINIPPNITSIGNAAFRDNADLVYITLPPNLTSIGWFAFHRCNSLTDIYCKAVDVPSADSEAFSNPENITLHVPYESLNAYQTVAPWKWIKFKNYELLSSDDLYTSENCSKPTISIVDGKFIFNCETPNVSYKWSISTPYGNNGNGGSVPSSITLNVFATKSGYLPSDVATYELSGLEGDVNNDGVVNVTDHVKLSDIILNKK